MPGSITRLYRNTRLYWQVRISLECTNVKLEIIVHSLLNSYCIPRRNVFVIYAALTPSDSRSESGLPSLLPPLAAAKQAEDYKILS